MRNTVSGIALFICLVATVYLSSWASILTALLCIGVYLNHIRVLSVQMKEEGLNELRRRLPTPLQLEGNDLQTLSTSVSQLWNEHAQLLNILSTIKEGVLAVDENRRIVMMNLAARRIFGKGLNDSLNTIDDSKLPESVIAAIEAGLDGQIYEGMWKKGSKPRRFYYNLFSVPAQSQSGCVLVIRDQTKVKRLERVRKDFIANISHELRTPVTIVRANAETLLEGAMDDPVFGPKFASAILRNGERLSRLINELLDLSRIEAGQYTMIIRRQPVEPVVNSVLLNLRTPLDETGHQVHVDIDSDLKAAFDDRALEQILSNYVENAIKYASIDAPIQINIRAVQIDTHVRIEVQDTGVGIPKKYLSRVFERFFRVDKGRSREAGGSGLGLSIVRHLAEAMNGSVGVQNAKPTGAVFWCVLPMK